METVNMELETLNKLYLELSQFATAKTQKEIDLEKRIEKFESALLKLRDVIYNLADQPAISDNSWEYNLNKIWDETYPIPF